MIERDVSQRMRRRSNQGLLIVYSVHVTNELRKGKLAAKQRITSLFVHDIDLNYRMLSP